MILYAALVVGLGCLMHPQLLWHCIYVTCTHVAHSHSNFEIATFVEISFTSSAFFQFQNAGQPETPTVAAVPTTRRIPCLALAAWTARRPSSLAAMHCCMPGQAPLALGGSRRDTTAPREDWLSHRRVAALMTKHVSPHTAITQTERQWHDDNETTATTRARRTQTLARHSAMTTHPEQPLWPSLKHQRQHVNLRRATYVCANQSWVRCQKQRAQKHTSKSKPLDSRLPTQQPSPLALGGSLHTWVPPPAPTIGSKVWNNTDQRYNDDIKRAHGETMWAGSTNDPSMEAWVQRGQHWFYSRSRHSSPATRCFAEGPRQSYTQCCAVSSKNTIASCRNHRAGLCEPGTDCSILPHHLGRLGADYGNTRATNWRRFRILAHQTNESSDLWRI